MMSLRLHPLLASLSSISAAVQVARRMRTTFGIAADELTVGDLPIG